MPGNTGLRGKHGYANLPWPYLGLKVQVAKQAQLSSCLDKLMTDVQRNLEARNRDKFTQVRDTVVLNFCIQPVLWSVHKLSLHFTHVCRCRSTSQQALYDVNSGKCDKTITTCLLHHHVLLVVSTLTLAMRCCRTSPWSGMSSEPRHDSALRCHSPNA